MNVILVTYKFILVYIYDLNVHNCWSNFVLRKIKDSSRVIWNWRVTRLQPRLQGRGWWRRRMQEATCHRVKLGGGLVVTKSSLISSFCQGRSHHLPTRHKIYWFQYLTEKDPNSAIALSCHNLPFTTNFIALNNDWLVNVHMINY